MAQEPLPLCPDILSLLNEVHLILFGSSSFSSFYHHSSTFSPVFIASTVPLSSSFGTFFSEVL